jgi:hypothetical protein
MRRGLLLIRHVTPLMRRDVNYFYSGAHILGRRAFAWWLENGDLEKFAGLHTSEPRAYRHRADSWRITGNLVVSCK